MSTVQHRLSDAQLQPPVLRVATAGPASEAKLWFRLRVKGDLRAREELARRHLPFVIALAQRCRLPDDLSDEMTQVANLGLLKAIDRFDPGRGVPFPGFAAPIILAELRLHFRDRVLMVRDPKSLDEATAGVALATTQLTSRLQRPATVAEIAEWMQVDELDVLQMMEASAAGWQLLEEAPPLAEDDRTVLRLRLIDNKTQSEIAEIVGCSQIHVSQTLRRSLAALRQEQGEPSPVR